MYNYSPLSYFPRQRRARHAPATCAVPTRGGVRNACHNYNFIIYLALPMLIKPVITPAGQGLYCVITEIHVIIIDYDTKMEIMGVFLK